MARNVSDEELQLKKRARRRLVGAIVLVTVVAVVLPMLLDSEPKPVTQDISIQIPSPDGGILAAKPQPLKPADPTPAVPTAAAPAPAPVPAPAVAPTPAKAEAPPPAKAETPSEPKPVAPAAAAAAAKPAAKAEAKPAASAPPATEAKAEAKPAAPAAAKVEAKVEAKAAKDKPKPAGGAFVVQVAALSDADKAKELQAKIAGSGIKAYTEVVSTAKGPVTRVRAGPYASREAAEKGRQQLQRLQLDGKVIPK